MAEIEVSERLAGSQWIDFMLAVTVIAPVVIRIGLLVLGWRPMVDVTHAVCIVATYIVCIGVPFGTVIFTSRGSKKGKMSIFKTPFYIGMLVDTLVITPGRLYLSNPEQINIFSNDLFIQHQLPRWIFALTILKLVFSTWFNFGGALWLHAAQVSGVSQNCVLSIFIGV